MTYLLPGLVPRTRGDPFLLPSLTPFPSGRSLVNASSRQLARITPSHGKGFHPLSRWPLFASLPELGLSLLICRGG